MVGCLLLLALAQAKPPAAGVAARLDHPAIKTVPSSSAAKATAFRVKLRAFDASMYKMSPSEAGTRWLDLVRESLQMKMGGFYGQTLPIVDFSEMIHVLPSPETWPAIESQLLAKPLPEKQKQVGLLLMFDVLQRNKTKEWEELGRLDSSDNGTARVRQDLALLEHNKPELIAVLRNQADSGFEPAEPSRSNVNRSMFLPDFVPILGLEDSANLLRYILTTAPAEVIPPRQSETETLAREVAGREVENLKWPQWQLAESLDASKLYEGCLRRFSDKKQWDRPGEPIRVESAFQTASLYYGIHLAAVGDPKKLAEFYKPQEQPFANPIDGGRLEGQIIRSGDLGKVLKALENLLLDNADDSLLRSYCQFAEQGGKRAQSVTYIKRLLAMPKWKQSVAVKDILDADRCHILPLAECLPSLLTEHAQNETRRYSGDSRRTLTIWLAQRLHRNGIAKQQLKKEMAYVVSGGARLSDELSDEFIKAGFASELERKLIEQVGKEDNGYRFGNFGERHESDLLKLYVRQSRWNDALALLDGAKVWGASDLAAVIDYYHIDFALDAVKALSGAGHKEAALNALNGLLQTPDPPAEAYRLLLSLNKQGAASILEKLCSNSPEDPAPFLFKAQWLEQHGKLREAEALAKKAIRLDPEDTAHVFSGHRYECYQLLAHIENGLGKHSEEQTALNAVEAGKIFTIAKDFEWTEYDSAAAELYRRELALRPTDYLARGYLAAMLARLGQIKEGCDLFNRAISEFARSGVYAYGYGYLSGLDICWLNAMPELKRLSVLNPKNFAVWSLLAEDYQWLGDPADEHRCQETAQHFESDADLWGQFLRFKTPLLLIGNRHHAYITQVVGQPEASTYLPFLFDYAEAWRMMKEDIGRRIPVKRPVYRLAASAKLLDDEPRGDVFFEPNDVLNSPGELIAQDRLIMDLMGVMDGRFMQ